MSQAIFAELRNDIDEATGEKNEASNVIFGTYIDKDSSLKPDGIKKMLKVRFHLHTVIQIIFIIAFKTSVDNEVPL